MKTCACICSCKEELRQKLAEEIQENDRTEKNLNETIDAVLARFEPLRQNNHNLRNRLDRAVVLLREYTNCWDIGAVASVDKKTDEFLSSLKQLDDE